MNRKRFLVHIAFICFVSRCLGQSNYAPEVTFRPSDLQDDFRVLQKVLEEVHIGLYRYSKKAEMDSLFLNTLKGIDHPMTELEFFRIVNRTVVAIRDEHTFALPSAAFWRTQIGQSKYDEEATEAALPLFPFFVKIIKGRIFIDNNLSRDQTLSHGDEILEIDSVPVIQVLNKLLPTVHTNGYVETFRYRNLEQFSLNQTYNRFIVHFALFIGTPKTFHLKVKRINHVEPEIVSVAALTSKELFKNYWRRYSTVNDPKKRRENPLEFVLLTDETAYLRISDLHNSEWLQYNYSYSTEFRTMFELIDEKAIKNLIVDLRGNEGGNLGIGIEFLKHLLPGPFRPYDHHEVNDYRYPELTKYFSDPSGLKNYPDKLFIRQKDGTYKSDPSYESESWSRDVEPFDNPYRNRIFVLIDGATGSAASILATLIRVNRVDAVFVGEESGGDMQGPISGEGTGIVLPNTKIRVDIPFIRRVVNLNGYKNIPGRGVMPDYRVTDAPDDLIANEDAALNFTISLIRHDK